MIGVWRHRGRDPAGLDLGSSEMPIPAHGEAVAERTRFPIRIVELEKLDPDQVTTSGSDLVAHRNVLLRCDTIGRSMRRRSRAIFPPLSFGVETGQSRLLETGGTWPVVKQGCRWVDRPNCGTINRRQGTIQHVFSLAMAT